MQIGKSSLAPANVIAGDVFNVAFEKLISMTHHNQPLTVPGDLSG